MFFRICELRDGDPETFIVVKADKDGFKSCIVITACSVTHAWRVRDDPPVTSASTIVAALDGLPPNTRFVFDGVKQGDLFNGLWSVPQPWIANCSHTLSKLPSIPT